MYFSIFFLFWHNQKFVDSEWLVCSLFGAFFLGLEAAATATTAAASSRGCSEAAAIQSLQNLQQCSIKRLRPTEAEARRVRGRFLNVVVVSSDGLEKEGKGLSWLSLSLRPRQAPALLTFQPASRPQAPTSSFSSSSARFCSVLSPRHQFLSAPTPNFQFSKHYF